MTDKEAWVRFVSAVSTVAPVCIRDSSNTAVVDQVLEYAVDFADRLLGEMKKRNLEDVPAPVRLEQFMREDDCLMLPVQEKTDVAPPAPQPQYTYPSRGGWITAESLRRPKKEEEEG